MLTYETLRQLKNLLLEISQGEQRLEGIRQGLAQNESFELYAAFQRIDRNSNVSIVAPEIINFLNENKIYQVTLNECQYLIDFFDSDGDKKLSYSDFMQMLVPCDNNFLRCQVTQRDTYRINKYQYLPMQLEQQLTQLLMEEIEMFRRCEQIRKDLQRRHDFSTYGCFRSIDQMNEGEINPDNIRQFLKSVGHYPNEDEVIAIVRRLDYDADCKISYEEFCDAIKTQEFSQQSSQQHQMSQYQEESKMGGYSQQDNKMSSYYQSDNKMTSQFDKKSPQRSQHSPLQPRDENLLVKSFREQLILERELERTKIDLIESCPEFNLFEAFKIIDRDGKGYATIMDILQACQSPYQLDLSEVQVGEVELFMARYDKNMDKKLLFSEFTRAFLPADEFYSQKLQQRQASYLQEKTLLLYRNLWSKHFKIEQQAEIIRDKLNSSNTFNIYDAFQAVDLDQNGKITKNELKRIIEQNGQFDVNMNEIDSLMERYDRNADGVISYQEFSEEIRPKSPRKQKY